MKKLLTFVLMALGSVNLVAQNEDLKPGDQVTITNPEFDDGRTGWTITSGYFYTYGSYYGQSSYKTFDINQTISGIPNGIYLLKVNANDRFSNDDSKIVSTFDPIVNLNTYIYINDMQSSVKSIMDDRVSTNIFLENNLEYLVTNDNCYITSSTATVTYSFNRGLYENYVLGVVTDNTLKIGIRHEDNTRTTNIDFDKFVVTYLSESTDMEAYALDLLNKRMSVDVKTALQSAMATLETSKGTDDEASALAAFYDKLGKAETSAQTYAKLGEVLSVIVNASTISKNIWPQTIEDAKYVAAQYVTAYQNGTLTDNDVINALMLIDDFANRINYVYVDINVTVPGALGDSILAKVENFSDVQTLKLKGKLNDDDIYTLKNRLTSLVELDLSELDWMVIPNEQFRDRTNLKRVILPNNVISIGNSAFYNCQKLQQVAFPTTLQSIGSSAFYQTYNIGNVVLPEGLTTIGDWAFERSRLTSLTLPSTLKTINNYCFYNCDYMKEVYFNGQTTIGYEAFYSCEGLTTIKFPNTLNKICGYSFAYNKSLSSIEFNEGLYQIEDNAFYDCDALTEVTLPSSLVLANESPFDYCDNLVKVTCLSIEPPYMVDQIPYGLGMEGRELYVPELSINVYKQTTGWDKFQTIKPIDYLPENIAVVSNLKLTLPETIPAEYKPNVTLIHDQKGTSYWQYGSLTVNGEGTLSMSDFSMFWDPNYQYDQYNRVQNYCSLVNNSHLRADQVYIDLYNRNDIWTFLTMPFDVKLSEIETYSEGTTNWIVRKYDGQKRAQGEATETWTKLSGDDVINAGEGFIIQGSRYIDNNRQAGSGFRMKAINNANKNNIFRTTDITVALNEYESEFAHNRSWNFIGNPYPSYYDTRFMDFEAPITVWNMRNSTYTAYSPADDAYILCPGEAFFVQRPIANGNIVFSKEGRQTDRNARTLDAQAIGRRVSDNQSVRTIINLSITNDKSTDRTRVVLNGQATMQYELDKDASKFVSTDPTVPQIYTIDNGVNYAINERPVADGNVILATYAGAEDFYTITLDNDVEGCQVALEDKAEGKTVVLTKEAGYTFSSKAGTFADRFVLHLTGGTTGIQTIDNEQSTMNNAVYDLQGRKLSTVFATPHSQGENSQLSTVKRGIYIKNGKKIILNK